MIYPFLMVSAVMPSILLIWYFRSRDVYPEPARTLAATFALGVAIVVPAALIELALAPLARGHGAIAKGFLEASIAGGTEEVLKYLVVMGYVYRHREFNEPMDGIVYGAIASLGFATLENVLYVAEGGLVVGVMRALLSVPGHASWGAIMGYFVGQARDRTPRNGGLLAWALVAPIALHTLYDFGLMAASGMAQGRRLADDDVLPALGLILLTLATTVTSYAWTVRLTGRLRREQLAGRDAAVARARAIGAAPYAQPVVPPAAPLPGYSPAAAAYAPQAPRGNPVLAWFAVLGGGALASVGGVIVLGSALALAFGQLDRDASTGMVCVGTVLGVLPAALGVWLFVRGVQSLNRAA